MASVIYYCLCVKRFNACPECPLIFVYIYLAEADLRIGELQWGDSGVYYCKVVIADDVVGQNEAYVELLVMGESAQEVSHYFRTGNSLAALRECLLAGA